MYIAPAKMKYGFDSYLDQSLLEPSRDSLPEHKLLIAILEMSIRDCVKGLGEHRRTAEVWLRSESCDEWSFRWVCDLLGWRVEEILEALKPLRRGGVWNGKRVSIRG